MDYTPRDTTEGLGDPNHYDRKREHRGHRAFGRYLGPSLDVFRTAKSKAQEGR
jgi:hypothetical protein